MTQTQQLIIAVLAVFGAGFFLVGTSEKTVEEKKNESMVAGYASMAKMASNKCPKAVKKYTGNAVYFPSDTETDKESYMTLTWTGGKDDSFKTATCTFTRAIGGISEVVVDGKAVFSK